MRKHDNDILVFQKTLLAVPFLDCSTAHRASGTLSTSVGACAYTHACLLVHCVNISLSAATSSGVRLIYCRHTRHIAIREIWPGKDRAYKLYARVGRVCVRSHVRVRVLIYRQIKRGHTMCYWKYTRGMVQSHVYICMCLR